ncbi:MAG: ATP-dependent helicase, partial [Calditrichaeota bacterium]|nr:ATP-dependent helicase [Calditrichota bacterium]
RDFREHQRLGELRLASLDLASHLDSSQQRDLFSRFFACSKSEEIETLLRDFLDDHSNRDRWKNSGELEETERILQEVKQQGLKTGLEDLDENQRRAVLQDPSTHVLLSAGPGSGKTHLLVHRCAWLLLEKELRPSQLLVLAYNRAVALELRSRLRQLFHNLGIRGEGERVPVLTLHSWAARTLRGRTRFMPLDEFHAALNELEIVHPEWIEIWTRSRTGTKARRPILRRIPEGYMVREDLLITREHPDDPGKSVEGVRLPLEMWISWAAWLLESTPGLTKPQHVLLDEVQDLNRERLDLVRSLVPDRSVSLFAVGDPDQSIYGYERRIDGDPMDPIHFLNLLVEHLEQEGGQVSRLTLRRNHRSTAPILEEAHRFQAISGEKRQTSKVAGGMPVRQIQVESEWLPALVDSVFQLVIGENRRLVTDSRDRIGVLFRTNGELLLAQQALLKDERFQNLMQMKAVRVITDRHYEHFYGFREWLLVREALGRLPEYVRPDLVLPQLEILRQEFRKLPGRWNTWAFNAGVALARLLIEDRPNDVSREEYLAELDDLVHEPASMLQALTGTGHKGTSKARPTTIVSLSTIHRAKGLQFDKVILAPTHHELTLMEEDREEERRIQYVARTRAARNLVIIKGPRERAFEENQCYRNPLPQVLVLDSAEKIYLSGMVHEKAFSTVEGLEDHQRFLHEEVRFEAPLLLVGNQLRLVQAEGFQRVVGLISQAFQKNILKHLSCLGLPSFTPMSGLSVGSVIRRELTEDELKFRIHPWIQARGFYWYVMPDGFLEPVPIKDSDDSLAANA